MKTRMVAAAFFVFLAAGTAQPAMAASEWPLVQSFAKSAHVHSPTFISPQRGWAIVGNRLLQTNESGTRWSVAIPPEWAGITPNAISFGTPTSGWVVANNGVVLATRDSGAHWNRQSADAIAGHDWVAVRALDGAHAIIAGSDGTLVGTDDGGTTWTLRTAVDGGQLSALYFFDALHGWAVGADASGAGLVLETDDGGGMWVLRSTPMTSALSAVTFADSARGWAAGPAGVLSTSDGGATWVAVAAPSEMLGAEHVSLAFMSPTTGFLGRERSSGSGPVLWKTTDGGAHWTPCPTAEESAGISDMLVLGSNHVLATGLSLNTGDSLTTARIWRWGSPATAGASTPSTSVTPRIQVAAKKAPAKIIRKSPSKPKRKPRRR